MNKIDITSIDVKVGPENTLPTEIEGEPSEAATGASSIMS
jgi:hypothetical protein